MAGHPKTFPARQKPSLDMRCVLSCLLSIWAATPVMGAQESTTCQIRPFQLRAMIDELPQLSRDELVTNKPDNLAIPYQAVDPQIASLTLPGPTLNGPPNTSAKTFGQNRPAQTYCPVSPDATQTTSSNGSLKEYNVDWSSWVSQLADRWFFALRSMEEYNNTHFFTPRAALVQFTCYANGQIGNICLRQSCGVPAYDQMQVQALLAVAPLPAFPAGSKRTSVTLIQGWDAHPRATGSDDYEPGSFGKRFPVEKVQSWVRD